MLNSAKRAWTSFSLTKKGIVVVLLPVVIFLAATLLTDLTLRRTHRVELDIQQTYASRLELERAKGLIDDINADAQAYLLSGQTDFLTAYTAGKERLNRTLSTLASLINQEGLSAIEAELQQDLMSLDILVSAAIPTEGEVVSSRLETPLNSDLFTVLQDRQRRNASFLALRQARLNRFYYLTLGLSLLLGVASGFLGVRLFILNLKRRIWELRENAESLAKGQTAPYTGNSRDELGKLNTSLNRAGQLLLTRSAELRQANRATEEQFAELTKQHQQIVSLHQLSSGLQTCQTSQALCKVFVERVAALAPSTSGRLYLFDKGRNAYRSVETWGQPVSENSFTEAQCLSPHDAQHYVQDSAAKHCSHLEAPYPAMSLCCSFMTQDQPLGVLHLQGDAPLSDESRSIIDAMADRFALALTNLRLRDTLRQQAMRDALTGLYNRRYLKETLERELQRAKRGGHPLSILIADIDHFKTFNDTYGHRAGDEVLKAFGKLLVSTFRVQDIPCRYGGEEFLVVLPETSSVSALQRAQQLIEQVRRLQVPSAGVDEDLSISIGVATAPEDSDNVQDLISRADLALYEAKSSGRDRAVKARSAKGA